MGEESSSTSLGAVVALMPLGVWIGEDPTAPSATFVTVLPPIWCPEAHNLEASRFSPKRVEIGEPADEEAAAIALKDEDGSATPSMGRRLSLSSAVSVWSR